MKRNFTISQQHSIEASGHPILVSAGAGSGKTTVLTERVIQKALQGIPIDRLIILTFTNAAAEEMRTRIRSRLVELNLQDQVRKLPEAKIMTFDAFCLDVVQTNRRFFGRRERITITDSIVFERFRKTIFKQVLTEAYLRKEEPFVETVKAFFSKGDRRLEEGLDVLIQGLSLIPQPRVWIQQYPEQFFSDVFLDRITNEFQSLFMERVSDFKVLLSSFVQQSQETDRWRNHRYFEMLSAFIQRVDQADFGTLIECILSFGIPRKPTLNAEDEDAEWFSTNHEALKNALTFSQKLIADLHISSIADFRSSLVEQQPHVKTMLQLADQYFELLNQQAKERNFADYAMVMNMAISLFENESEIREDIKGKTHEIMIDEYQDTNDFQEYLISLIAHENVFMVGDMKQSIYRFRNANPANFARKFHEYASGQGGEVIVLSENFRSRSEVLKAINTLFEPMMDDEIGGIDYRANQALQYGNHGFDIRKDPIPGILIHSFDSEALKQENPTFFQARHEANLLASRIASGHGVDLVTCLKEQSMKPSEWRDYVILVDRKSHFTIYEEALNQYGIPYQTIRENRLGDGDEIRSIRVLMELMQTFLDDSASLQEFQRAFLGVQRSFWFRASDLELFDFVHSLSGDSIEAWNLTMSDPTYGPSMTLISTLASLWQHMSPKLWMEEVLDRLHTVPSLEGTKEPWMALDRLDRFVAIVDGFQPKSIQEIIDYLQDMEDNPALDIAFEQPIDWSRDTVKMMTIHKSKGLEFPYVLMPGLSRTFLQSESKSYFLFDPEYGFFFKRQDQGIYDMFLHVLVREKAKIAEISERMRLLYVALTRAKEQVILLFDQRQIQEGVSFDPNGRVTRQIRRRFRSFAHMIGCVAPQHWFEEGAVLTRTEAFSEVKMSSTIVEDLPFSYPISLNQDMRFSKHGASLFDSKTKSAIRRGIEMHAILELVDWKNPIELPKVAREFARVFPEIDFQHDPIWREYRFYDPILDGIGVIDFFAETEDKIILIDYKSWNIDDDSYRKQVNLYRQVLSRLYTKPIQAFLYSIEKSERSEVFPDDFSKT